MPQAKIFSMYGQTECTRTLYMPPEDIDRKPGSVGGAIPNEEVWLEDEQGQVVTKPGEFGELVVRGANIMRGYWEDPDATAKWLSPGRYRDEVVLRSQDLFTLDEDGYLYFVSRRDDMIKVGGQKVSPREVESVLHTIPGVAEAAVIGPPDPLLGQVVKAVVVLKAGATYTEAELRREAGKQLEDFMVPKIVEFVTELPKTVTGKVKKADLK
jgi:long-chain acyl-CoA synthetase